MHQLLVVGPTGRTWCLDFESASSVSGRDVRLALRFRDRSLSDDHFSLFAGTHRIADHESLSSCTAIIRCSVPLLGGKGGFGALLRGASTKVGQKKTTNFGACRDLSGRRIRHVEDEKALADWQVEEHEIDKQKLKEEFKRIKDGRSEESMKPCRFGDDCKYKWKCRHKHPSDDAKPLPTDGGKLIGVKPVDYSAIQEETEERVAASVAAGLAKVKGKKKASANGASAQSSTSAAKDDEKEADVDDPFAVFSSIPALASSSSSSSSSPSTSSSAKHASHGANGSVTITPMDDKPASNKRTHTAAADNSAAQDDQAGQKRQKAPNGTASHVEPKAEEAKIPDGAAKDKQPAAPVSYGPIDLSQYQSAADLERVGADHLKHELARLGLKCGGTPLQRAERLFLLKSTPIDKLDRKHFAK